jgi:alkylation response protein AidB-like acyl-CoA dehydrogenase
MSVGLVRNSATTIDGLGPVVEALAAAAGTHDADGSFPHEAFEELWRHGVLGLVAPTQLGGGGAGLETSVRVLVELGRGDPSVALVLALHLLQHAHMNLPDGPWPRPLRERLQRSLQDGPAIVNALRVEPELGTPARGGLPATVAERLPDGSGYRLRGRKIYSTGAPGLRWLVVYARTDDPEPLVGQFVVDAADRTGWRIEPTWNHLGMRATASHDVVLDGAFVAADSVVGLTTPDAVPAPDPVLAAWNPLLIAATYHGVAVAARDWLTGYLHHRVPSGLGRPLATLPRFQEAVGRIEAGVRTAGRLLSDTARRVDEGGDGLAEALADAGVVKLTVTNSAIDVVSNAVALVGNPGLSRGNDLERHLRNVLCSRIHTPQDDMILAGAGRAALASAANATGAAR